MDKQLTIALMALVLVASLLLPACWRKKAISVGAGGHGIEFSKTERGNTARYDVDAK